MKSTFLTLKMRDFLKGLVVAILSPVVPIIIQSLAQKVIVFDWYVIRLTAIGAFTAYISKNFVTDDVKQSLKVLEEEKIISSSNAKKIKTAAPKDEELNK